MGGRGGSSGISAGQGKIKAIVIDYGNGRMSSFRLHPNGLVTDIDDFAEQKNTNKLTLAEIADRAVENGYSVMSFTQSQLNERDKKRKDSRANRPDYELGIGVPWGNKEYRKTARRNRINTRISRKRNR